MNNKGQRLKQLAIIAAQNEKIPSDIGDYVLNYLGKQELKEFLKYYKSAIEKRVIYVSSPNALSYENIEMIKNVYKGKKVELSIDPTLGAGLKVQERDMIVDFTIKKYINDTIEKLKN